METQLHLATSMLVQGALNKTVNETCKWNIT